MNQIVLGDSCISCGTCISMTELITIDDSGRAVICNWEYIKGYDLDHINEVIKLCPQNNISVTYDLSIVKKEGIIELIDIIDTMLKDYEVSFPEVLEYEFNKEDYNIDTLQNLCDDTRAGEFLFENEAQAEFEGLKSFDSIMYSQKNNIVHAIFMQYIVEKLKKYYENTHQIGNFYYGENVKAEKLLQNIITEANFLTNNSIKLSDTFSHHFIEPEFGIDEHKLTLCLKELKDCHYVKEVLNRLEPLSWFEKFINTSFEVDKRNKHVYSYDNLTEVCEVFAAQIINECDNILSNGIIKKELLEILRPFLAKVEESLSLKADELISELELYL